MPRRWLIYVLLLAVGCGITAPVITAMGVHYWRAPVDTWLPGAWSLFFPPLLFSAAGFAFLALRFWNPSTLGVRLAACILAVCGTFAGILASIPFVCLIANECL